MRALLLSSVLLLALVPGAAASTFVCVPAAVAFACAGDVHASQESCSTSGYEYGYDTAFVFSPAAIAAVYAGRSCYAGQGLSQEVASMSADVFTPVVAAQLHWSSIEQTDATGSHSSCTMQVHVGTSFGWNSVSQPCVAGGPPNPGWGQLLP